MKWSILFLCLLSLVPSSWATSEGAPEGACADLMPQHGSTQSMDGNDGFFLTGDVVTNGSYVPGQSYRSKRRVMGRTLKGFVSIRVGPRVVAI